VLSTSFLIAVGALTWWIIAKGVFSPPLQLPVRLESRLTVALHQAGVKDIDVQSTLREECSNRGSRWIKTTRMIRASNLVNSQALKKQLQSIGESAGGKTQIQNTPHGWVLEISFRGRTFEKLIYRGQERPSLPRKNIHRLA